MNAAPINVLVADPAWQPDDELPGDTRGAAKQYETMPVERICALPIPELGANAVLFLWRLASMQPEALEVVRAWGFTLKAEVVWDKETVLGNDHFGMGRYVRNSHEVCLIATRGSALPAVRNERSRFSAPVRAHSQKPDEFYEKIVRMYPFSFHSRHYEMFARTVRPGWTQFGFELGKLGVATTTKG